MLRMYLFFIPLLIIDMFGQIEKKVVEYKDGNVVLEGYVAYKGSMNVKRPGILVIHEWKGLNNYVKRRCDMLAELGYVAFAGDIYGKDIRPKSNDEAGKQASIYRNDRKLMRHRVNLALEEMLQMKNVDKENVAAMGYCFGGGVVLELARSGANIKGVVSFHGNLDTPDMNDAKNIKGKILICHGSEDPNVPLSSVDKFIEEMKNAKVDYEVDIYSKAVHGFTNPENGSDPSKGVAYNKSADVRSWEKMKNFFDEIFK